MILHDHRLVFYFDLNVCFIRIGSGIEFLALF